MSWQEVERMPFSEFVRSYKAATMLDAHRMLNDIKIVSFPNYSETDRSSIVRDLKHISTQFMEKQVKDYREVLGNLAKRLMKNV